MEKDRRFISGCQCNAIIQSYLLITNAIARPRLKFLKLRKSSLACYSPRIINYSSVNRLTSQGSVSPWPINVNNTTTTEINIIALRSGKGLPSAIVAG
jgi:hypothetical protein